MGGADVTLGHPSVLSGAVVVEKDDVIAVTLGRPEPVHRVGT